MHSEENQSIDVATLPSKIGSIVSQPMNVGCTQHLPLKSMAWKGIERVTLQ